MKILIIGFGGAGFFAAMSAKKTNKDAEITIIEKRDYDMFSPCGLPYAIEGIITFESLKHEILAEKMGMVKLLRHEAIKINPDSKTVEVRNLETKAIKTLNYDCLIIATGANPIIPPIKGVQKFIGKGIYVVDTPESAEKIKKASEKSNSALVIGAGAIGLEVAVSLKKLGLDVTVVEMLPYTLPKAIDPDISKILEKHLKKLGIGIKLNKKVHEIIGNDSIESVLLDSGDCIKTDFIVLAVGVHANLDLAKSAGIKTSKWGILTNPKMETSIKDIYAVGDCVETVSLINHRPWMMQLATSAYKQGMIAGKNAVGGYSTYSGSLTTFVTVIGNLEVAATGFNQFFCDLNGYKTVIGKAKGKTKPEEYPNAKDITVKIIADAQTGRILGGQAIGEEGAAWRINVIALAIKNQNTIYDLSDAELCYCPVVSSSYDVLTKAADFAIRKFEKRF
ncbi:MAG: FAD-dependent oxidoreductase [Methanosarcinales archaeon]